MHARFKSVTHIQLINFFLLGMYRNKGVCAGTKINKFSIVHLVLWTGFTSVPMTSDVHINLLFLTRLYKVVTIFTYFLILQFISSISERTVLKTSATQIYI